MPPAACLAFGGDFNDGPGGSAMAAIDARFTPAELIAGQNVTNDQPVGVLIGDGIIDRGLDHFYLGDGPACRVLTSLFPVENGRQFSDHPIVVADLELPSSPDPVPAAGTAVEPGTPPSGP
jgi:endonuclease/exonuclease/phosphatase family metal-dependent hydrolase